MTHQLSISMGTLVALVSFHVTGCVALEQRSPNETTNASAALFNTSVKPLFESRCVWCHSQANPQGGLNFEDREGLLSSERSFIVPRASNQSLVFQAVTLEAAHPKVMPGDGWGISAEHEASLKQWIDEGAHWPDGPAGQIERKPYRVEIDDL